MGKLEGKVAIVTGGNMGIGAAASRLFAQEGASVVLAARRVEEGEAVAESIRAAGGKAIFVPTDVSRASDCRNLVARTVAEFGKLDIAFNNAGVEQVGKTILELEEEEFDHTIAVNLKGVFLCMKSQIPEMLKAGGGSIVNTSSLATIVTKPGLSGYGASKFGVIGLTRFGAVEYAKDNIRVNALVPGATRTEMFSRWLDIPGVEEEILAGQPNGRFADPMELAKAALFLASDDASFVSGHAMVVDGAAALP
ncbi:SDR family NAD(P)-dependent oxidoreductase [Novosphingobium beihaiensis]|uniref:Glucose 1-dehydrogenase n=1 Tax=Novosphingobium beihaiensis TaxID=2930389 RepID=A0ABT0BTS4_9SPHN|nr:glucose 1-dehydrogenase [Novosphingobium beihaiensis]MCJ2188439.1 glucose 1-dehydrogenase [Novosphingobium beihaiensis]